MAYGILSNRLGMTNTVPVPDATDPTDLSRASRVASNLSLAT